MTNDLSSNAGLSIKFTTLAKEKVFKYFIYPIISMYYIKFLNVNKSF